MEEEDNNFQYFVNEEIQPSDFYGIPQEKFNGQKNLKKIPLQEKTKTYFRQPDKYKQNAFIELFSLHCKNQQIQKSVCAKVIAPNETIAECYNCRTDGSCIICMDCYKNGNHEGHKVIFKKAYGGCCDCGDPQAWKSQGFCKNHTGEVVEIQIDKQDIQHFQKIFFQLFYLYFRQNLMNNQGNFQNFGKSLIQNLQYINEKGVYYNKLTYILLQKKLPIPLKLSENADKRTILQNILCPITSGSIGKQWMDLFILMFPYYPFKKLLLKTYIQNYSLIYNASQQSKNNGSSISCQLMTSYQLVRQYALQEGNIPIGNDIQPKNLKELENVIYNIIHDLNYTCKLQGDTPLIYWRFHIKNNFLKLFQYVKIIAKQQQKSPQDPNILKLAKSVKFFQIQSLILQCMSMVATAIKDDTQILQIAIKILYEQALKNDSSQSMVIFRPIQRTLCLFLFTYAKFNLQNVANSNFSEVLINNILKTNQQEFTVNINKIFRNSLKTYLFYAKILSSPGLNSTLYPYIYFYKVKNRFLSALDIVWIKLLVLIKQLDPVITLRSYIQNAQKQITKNESSHFILLLNELKIVVVSKSSQIYLAYKINPTCNLYESQIYDLLIRLLTGQKVPVTVQLLKQYQESFFSQNVNLIGIYMKKICNFDKTKKAFTLKEQYQSQYTLNYQDFKCNLTNKQSFQDPQKTLSLIRKTYNVKIHQKIWSIETMKKTLVFGIEIIKAFLKNNTDFEQLRIILFQICKILYQKRKLTESQATHQQLDIIIKLLKKVQGIEPLLDSFYKKQFYSQKSEIQEKQKEIEEKEKQRKRILKEKMELKKKKIKEKYNMQSQTFVQNKKQKQFQKQPQTQNQHKCIICRHQNPEDAVYLVNLQYRNHEKLLGMGQGVYTLSIQSCFHVLDYTCYKKMIEKLPKTKPIAKCPFCKFEANSFFPAKAVSPHLDQSIKNAEMTIFSLKNFDQISVIEEFLKSFYHYSLLGILDPQRTINKRGQIQRLILQMLKSNPGYFTGLPKIFANFLKNKINLRPKFNINYKKMDHSRKKTILTFIQNSVFQDQNELLDTFDMQDYQQYFQHFDNPQSQQSQGFFQKLNKFKQKLIKKKSQKLDQRQTVKMTPIMRRTLKMVFEYLGFKDQNKEQQETNPYVEYCLNQLFMNQQENSLILSSWKSQENYNLLKLRQLPLKYLPLSKYIQCDSCKQMSTNICICLFCDWKSCLKNCLKGKEKKQEKGGCFAHSSNHGEICLFLSIIKCQVYLLDSQSGISLGVLYKDEWGNNFEVKKDWDEFYLDEFLLQKIKVSFLYDEPLN